MAETGIRAFVCGHPISHSRSPLIHGYWLKRYGIEGSYSAVDVTPEDFSGFLRKLPEKGFAGGNVTIPHKEAAFALVQARDKAAESIGAVNTVWMEDGRLWGGNTDAYGFAANLDDRAPGWETAGCAVVLGAGGAARAVVHALKTRGIGDIRIVNRTLSRARELADRFGAGNTAHGWDTLPDVLSDAGIVINTTSLGMEGDKSVFALDLSPLPRSSIVTDIVYIPLETPLLKAARERDLKTVDGLGMLLHQAVPGFERWFGRRPEVTAELRNLVIADMEKKH